MPLAKKATWLLLLFAVCFTSCKKEYNSIGLNLEDELLGTSKDTTTITAYSVLYDTLNTTNLSNQILGELHDPIFGKTVTMVYSQFLSSGSIPSFGDEAVVDSVVLTLQTAGYYGDTTAALHFEVYELTEDLTEDDNYYNYSTTEHSNNNLLNQPGKNYYIRPNTPITIGGELLSPHLRIRISPEFGQHLIDASDDWMTDDAILADFKGLCIQATTSHSTGCLFSSNMTSSLTGLVIYYHNSLGDGMNYTFRPSESGITYNNYNHFGYSDACQDLRRQILDHDSTNITQLYIQAMGGVRTKIRFPYIRKKFANIDNRVVINRAELVITDCNPNENVYLRPTGLSIQGVKNDGSLYYIPDDDILSADGYFGGTYNASTGEYRIRITQYLQQLILNQGDYADYFYLIVKGSGIHANRLVFHSSTDNTTILDKSLRVEIAYTTY
jgi:hypothetical protein